MLRGGVFELVPMIGGAFTTRPYRGRGYKNAQANHERAFRKRVAKRRAKKGYR